VLTPNLSAMDPAPVPRAARVVIVDDHRLFRVGVRAELAPAHDVVGEAASVAEAIEVIGVERPEVVLLDVHLPGGGGVAVLEAMTGVPEAPAFLALSASDASADVVRVIRAGARGYVTKTIATEDLIDAVGQVASGGVYFSAKLATFVLRAFSGTDTVTESPGDPLLASLTPRERDVLRRLARGQAYKRIAQQLDISPRTVESHVRAVLRKLQLSSRNEVAHWAAERGLTDGPL
jgi:DNA-binding NarL/FixJ family response regulator